MDAAIVYRVNALLQKEHLDFIEIKHDGAKAVQPFSVRDDSPKKQLALRLQDYFLAHPEVFEGTGFRWRGRRAAHKKFRYRITALVEKIKNGNVEKNASGAGGCRANHRSDLGYAGSAFVSKISTERCDCIDGRFGKNMS